MRYLPLLILAAFALACANGPVQNAAIQTHTTPTPYPTDLAGQAARASADQNFPTPEKSITYEMIKKSPDKYLGLPWTIRGRVLEITETNGKTVARISVGDDISKFIICAGIFETEVVDHDRVVATGYLAEPYSYTSQANWNISAPSMGLRSLIKVR